MTQNELRSTLANAFGVTPADVEIDQGVRRFVVVVSVRGRGALRLFEPAHIADTEQAVRKKLPSHVAVEIELWP